MGGSQQKDDDLCDFACDLIEEDVLPPNSSMTAVPCPAAAADRPMAVG
jgi:hypothetical protein